MKKRTPKQSSSKIINIVSDMKRGKLGEAVKAAEESPLKPDPKVNYTPKRQTRKNLHRMTHAVAQDRGVSVQEIAERLENDPFTLGFSVFHDHFEENTPPFHKEIMDYAINSRFLAIASPRESAKSTLIAFLYVFHKILFKKKRFIIMISNTFAQSVEHLNTMKREMRENEKLRMLFPGLVLSKDAEGNSIFRHPDGFETLVICRGQDQIGSIRGLKFGPSRPDLIIGDDMENDELVRSPDRRAKLQEDFDVALLPAGARHKCQYIMIGTILHDDSQLAKLLSPDYYKNFRKVIFRAHLDVGKPTERSLWNEKWTVDWLNTLKKEDPRRYAKEYQNDPVAASNTRFKREHFRRWGRESDDYVLYGPEGHPIARGSMRDCRPAIACDLAWKEKRENDYSVIMPGYLTPTSEILVDDYILKRGMRPNEVAEILFTMTERMRAITGSDVPVGFEKAMLENVTKWLLRQEMQQRNSYIQTRELKWDGDKIQRIETRLEARYCQHSIFHKPGMGELEHQLERFPFGSHDDLADCLQGLVQLLQFPKERRVESGGEDMFMRLRALASKSKQKPKFNFFGERGSAIRKQKFDHIPAIRSVL